MNPYLLAWIASIPGVGPKRFALLHAAFPDLSALLSVSLVELLEIGIPPSLARAVLSHQRAHPVEEIQEFCEQNQVQVVVLPSLQVNPGSSYPVLLQEISDPPAVLYVKGVLPPDDLPKIAVVGTRNVTHYGKQVTTELTTQLVGAGFVIVSGFMYGVDAIAHQTTIEQGGKTIAVLGYGLGVTYYPREHKQLGQRLIEAGSCLLTEFPPWQYAKAQNFPLRNRIVSGLSLGTVVTEAAKKSGSKITARLAVEQGREVFAVPGPMDSPFSEGTKELVNLGAKLVTSVQDIVEELR